MQLTLSAIGDDLENDSSLRHFERNENQEFNYDEESPKSVPYIIGEDTGRRGENEKCFRLSDGSFLRVWYMDTVHYLEDDEWKDIDNTLELSAEGYTNAASEMKVVFSSDVNSGELYSVEYKDSAVSFSVYDGCTSSETENAVFSSETFFDTENDVSTADSVENMTEGPGYKITADESLASVTEEIPEEDIRTETLGEAVSAEISEAYTDQAETADEEESDLIEVPKELPRTLPASTDTQSPDNALNEPILNGIDTYDTKSKDVLVGDGEADTDDSHKIMPEENSDTDFVRTYNRSIILKENNSAEANRDSYVAQSAADAVNKYKESNEQASEEKLKEIAAEQNRINMKQRAEIMSSAGECSEIVYKGAVPRADSVEYSVGGRFVKENIVIDGIKESYMYRFKLDTDLAPVLNEDGSIDLKNEDETLFFIPAPYMTDADGVRSDEVSYSLEDISGTSVLTVTAEPAWIEDSQRAFPVRIDPTIFIGKTSSSDNNIITQYISDSDMTNVHQGENVWYTGCNPVNGNYYSYLKINNLPPFSDNCKFVQAHLYTGMYTGGFFSNGILLRM